MLVLLLKFREDRTSRENGFGKNLFPQFLIIKIERLSENRFDQKIIRKDVNSLSDWTKFKKKKVIFF